MKVSKHVTFQLIEDEKDNAPDGKEAADTKTACDGGWRYKLASREEKLKYLETAERYWYSKEWYGSEKRKTPA